MRQRITTIVSENISAHIGSQVTPNYGNVIEYDHVERDLTDKLNFQLHLKLNINDTTDIDSISSDGKIATFTGFLMAFAKTPLICVDAIHDTIYKIGYEYNENIKSYRLKPNTPYPINTMQFYKFIPRGGLKQSADRVGNDLYIFDQMIALKFQTKE